MIHLISVYPFDNPHVENIIISGEYCMDHAKKNAVLKPYIIKG